MARRATRSLSADSRTASAHHVDEEVTCEPRASQAGENQQAESGDIQETSQDEADVGEVQVMMAETVPEMSCSAGSETVCSDQNRFGTLAQTFEWFDENHTAQDAHPHEQ